MSSTPGTARFKAGDSSTLSGDVQSPEFSGYLLKEGNSTVLKTYKQRYFTIRRNQTNGDIWELAYFEKMGGLPKGTILLRNAVLSKSPSDKKLFGVAIREDARHEQGRLYMMKAADEDLANKWLEKIKLGIDKSRDLSHQPTSTFSKSILRDHEFVAGDMRDHSTRVRTPSQAAAAKVAAGNSDMFELLGNKTDVASGISTTIQIGDLVLLGSIDETGKVECVINAEGFFTERVFPKSKMDYFYIAAFRVTPPLQYDARVEHEQQKQLFVRRSSSRRSSFGSRGSRPSSKSIGSADDVGSFAAGRRLSEVDRSIELKASQLSLNEEKRKNKAKLDKVINSDADEFSTVHYGDYFQLQHVVSGKFLSASPDGTFQVVEHGTRYSIFKAAPRFRFREDGDGVLYDDEVLLNCVARGSEMLAMSSSKKAGTKQLVLKDKLGDEVTYKFSSETLDFAMKFHKLARYPSTKAIGIPNPLKTDRMVKLWCHEARGLLAGPMKPASGPKEQQVNVERRLQVSSSTQMDDDDLALISRAIWQFEEVSPGHSSLVAWTKLYRLRHSLSLKYLSIGEKFRNVERDDGTPVDPDTEYFAATLIEPNLIDMRHGDEDNVGSVSTFRFKNTELNNQPFLNLDDCTFRIRHDFDTKSGTGQSACYLTFDAAGLIVNSETRERCHIYFGTKENIEDTFHIIAPPQAYQQEIRILRSMRDVAERYCRSFEFFEDKDVELKIGEDQMNDSEHQQYLDYFEDWEYQHEYLIEETKAMLQVLIGEAIIAGGEEEIEGFQVRDSNYYLNEISGPPNRDFQGLARESKTLDVLMAMIMAPVNSNNLTLRKVANWYHDDFKDQLESIREIQDHLFKLMEALIDGNVQTEMYVAEGNACRRVPMGGKNSNRRKSMSVHASSMLERQTKDDPSQVLSWPWRSSTMLQDSYFTKYEGGKHPSFAQPLNLRDLQDFKFETEKWVESMISAASSMPTAQSCLSTLLSNNEELLDHFVSEATVQRFIENITENGPEAATMNFFKAICSCKGRQILSNQELCLRKLMGDKNQRAELMVETTTFPVDMYKYVNSKNSSADCSFNDFCRWYQRLGPGLEDLFQNADVNKDGKLTLKELHSALKTMKINLPRNDIQFFMERCDQDMSGGLEIDEFKYFFISQMHPRWESDFEKVRAFWIDHRPQGTHEEAIRDGLRSVPWKYSTLELSEKKEYREKIMNQPYHYDGGRKAKENKDFREPKQFLGVENFKNENGEVDIKKGTFDPVFVGWTGLDDWKAGENELFLSPSALAICDDYGRPYKPHYIDSDTQPNSEHRVWIPIEKVCWILQPERLFVDVIFPRAAKQIKEQLEASAKSSDEGANEIDIDGRMSLDNPVMNEQINKILDEIYGKKSASRCYSNQDDSPKFWWFDETIRDRIIHGLTHDMEEMEDYRNLLQIAKYYESQIYLFAEMCLDRSYNSIYEMQRQFSYETLISCVANDLLPDQIRSGYCLLLLRVYIDRYPHAEVRAPDPVQIFEEGPHKNIAKDMVIYNPEELDGDKMVTSTTILPQFRIPKDGPLSKGRVGRNMPLTSLFFLMFGIGNDEEPGDKFYLVEDFVTTFLLQEGGKQDPEDKERNTFVLSVLQLVQSLVKFGFFGSYYELTDVVTPLAELLNGSKDGDEGDRTEKTPENQLVFDSKRSIIKSLMDMTSLRDDYRQKVLMSYFKESVKDGLLSEESLLFPNLLAEDVLTKKQRRLGTESVPLKILIKDQQAILKKASDWYQGPAQYMQREVNKICEKKGLGVAFQTPGEDGDEQPEEGNMNELVLSSYCQFRINDVFEDIEGEKVSGLPTHDYAQLDLDRMSPSENLVAICMDLMMYDDPELFECAFSLLWSQFNQRSPVVEALQHVMLLEDPVLFRFDAPLVVQWDSSLQSSSHELERQRCVIVHVKHLKSFRQLLRRGIEAYELWGTSEHEDLGDAEQSNGDDEKFIWFLNLLGYMTAFMKFQTRSGRQDTQEPCTPTICYPPNQDDPHEIIPDFEKHVTSVERDHNVITLQPEDLGGSSQEPATLELRPYEPERAEVNPLHQQLVFGFAVHEVMLNALDIPIHKGKRDNTARYLRQLVAAALENLRLFVKLNPKHQEVMYNSIDVLFILLQRNCRGLDEREPEYKYDETGFDRRMNLTIDGVDLISMIESRIADLLAAIFDENPALVEKVSYSEYLEPLSQLLVKRTPDYYVHLGKKDSTLDTRFLRIFLTLGAHGGAAAKSRVLQTLTSREVGGAPNELVTKYLHDLDETAKESDTAFQAMLLTALAYCCCPSTIWCAWAKMEEGADDALSNEKREAYMSAVTHLRGFMSVNMCLEGIQKNGSKLALQSAYMQCLTALYLSSSRLVATLRRAASSGQNPLPDLVDNLLVEASKFKPNTSTELQKYRMSNAVLPLLYSYFTNVHKQQPHTLKSMKRNDHSKEDGDGGAAYNAAHELCIHMMKENPNFFLPYPLRVSIVEDDETSLMEVEKGCNFYQEAMKTILDPTNDQHIDNLGGFFTDFSFPLNNNKMQRKAKTKSSSIFRPSLMRMSSIGLNESKLIEAEPMMKLQNKHAVLEELLQKLTEDEEVLFVSEAKAAILNKQRRKVGLLPIQDLTKVPLIKFLVFEFQKLELGKKYDGTDMDWETKKKVLAFGEHNLDGFVDPLFPEYQKILGKMINHVKINILREIDSGFDTKEVNVNIMDILTAILEDARPPEDGDNLIEDASAKKQKIVHASMQKQFIKKQTQIGKLGALDLVLDVLAYTELSDDRTIKAALTLGTALLHGGNLEQQKAIWKHFTTARARREGHLFFSKIVSHLRSVTDIITQTPSFITTYDDEDDDRTSKIANLAGLAMDFCRLWVEGHNRELQEFLVGQDKTTIELKKSYNFLSFAIRLYDKLTSDASILMKASDASLKLLRKAMDFVTEISQGPCIRAQDYIVDETSLVTFIRRLIMFTHRRYEKLGKKTGKKYFATRKLLLELLSKSGMTISAMMEGRGGDSDQRIYLEVKESMKSQLFKTHAKKVCRWRNAFKEKETRSSFSWKKKTGNQNFPAWISELSDEDKEDMVELLNEAASELYVVYMQLGSAFKSLKNELTPGKRDDQEYRNAFYSISQATKRVEFIWSGPLAPPGSVGRVDLLYFRIPEASGALTTASKAKLEAEVNVDSSEQKKRDFLLRSADLVAEMEHLQQISQSPVFRLIQRNIDELRNVAFSVGVMVNVLLALSVSGKGNEGFNNRYEEGYDTNAVHIRDGPPKITFRVLSIFVALAYSVCFVYAMIIRAPLLRKAYLRRRQKREQELDKSEEDADVTVGAGDNSSSGAAIAAGANFESANELLSEGSGEQATEDPDKKEDDGGETKTAAENIQEKLKLAAENVFGDDRFRKYLWKLARVWFPFMKLLIGLAVLVGVIASSPSSPAHSPAEWKWIVMAASISTVSVFFPTLDRYIFELRKFHGPLWAPWNAGVQVCIEYAAFYNAVMEPETLTPFIMAGCAVGGIFRYYLSSFVLIDIIFLNARLKNVIRAVTATSTDLAVTFVLITFIVFIFASFGMYQFGQITYHFSDESLGVSATESFNADGEGFFGTFMRDDDEVSYSVCPNLAVCFLEFFDAGLRTGDIVGATFDDISHADKTMTYFGRIVFGLAFFLVIGVVLFDIITGIIIDKFSELRERTTKRLERLKNSTFISDIERDTCDENGLDFDEINNIDQDKWNYLYLMAHLEFKDKDDYTGAESMIAAACKKYDISWLPEKTCWAMQIKSIAADIEDPDTLILQLKDDLMKQTDEKLGPNGTLMGLIIERFEKMDQKLNTLMKASKTETY